MYSPDGGVVYSVNKLLFHQEPILGSTDDAIPLRVITRMRITEIYRESKMEHSGIGISLGSRMEKSS